MDDSFPVSERNRVRRRSQRGRYDKATVHAILDEALICHVAFEIDGQPFAIPTVHAREGDVLYMHGSTANRMLEALAGGAPVCVTATIVDGLVLARSAFHHSMNYRSVVAFGQAALVEDPTEKNDAFRALVERMMPGRWEDCRQPTEDEMKATHVLRLRIEEASAKVRSGDPVDDEEDHSLPCWAGVVPVNLHVGEPKPADDLNEGIAPPRYLATNPLVDP